MNLASGHTDKKSRRQNHSSASGQGELVGTEAETKEKHGVWDPMPEFTITSPLVDYNTFTMNNPMPESTLTLCQSRLYPPVRDLRFGLSSALKNQATHRVHILL
jgi:hypothetical protein